MPLVPFCRDPAVTRIFRMVAGVWGALLIVAAGCGMDREAAGEQTGNSPPARAVVMAPAAAEMLEALDLLDRVIGIGQFGPWPEALQDLPVSGSYSEPNVETVLSLRADALLSAKSQAADRTHRRLEDLGIRVIELDTSTHDGIFAGLAEVGRVFDREEEAAQVARSMRDEIRRVEDRAKAVKTRRVLFVVGSDPMYVAGPGSHIDRMIQGVGGTNIAHDAMSAYQQVSVEAMLERMPEVIIDTSDNRPEALRGRQPGDWERWKFLPAVKAGRVFQIHPSRLVIPGMRLPEMTRLMGQLIHPELYGEPADDQFGSVSPELRRADAP